MVRKQPKLDVSPRRADLALSWLGGFTLVLMLAACLHYYPDIADRIPTKFKEDGSARSYSGKQVLFALPIIGLPMWVLLHTLSKYPHIYNYAWRITAENAMAQYLTGMQMMLQLNAVMSIGFAWMGWETLKMARCLCDKTHIDLAGTVLTIMLFAVIAFYVAKAYSLR